MRGVADLAGAVRVDKVNGDIVGLEYRAAVGYSERKAFGRGSERPSDIHYCKPAGQKAFGRLGRKDVSHALQCRSLRVVVMHDGHQQSRAVYSALGLILDAQRMIEDMDPPRRQSRASATRRSQRSRPARRLPDRKSQPR